MKRLFQKILLAMFAVLFFAGCATSTTSLDSGPSLRVMTFNILKGGTQLGQTVSRSAEVVQAVDAEIVILEERENSADDVSELLGYNWVPINSSVAILSVYPVERHGRFGARVDVPRVGPVYVFGVHLEAYPYGPYDLRDDPTLTEIDLIEVASQTREHQFAPVLEEIAELIVAGDRVILGGDFNEPSHLDWTSRAAAAGRNFGRKVAWPTSSMAYATGLLDSYRIVRGDEVRHPGLTWTPRNESEFEVHDRIDILYHGGEGIIPIEAKTVGAREDQSDVVVTPYPSDHRAVVVEYRLP